MKALDKLKFLMVAKEHKLCELNGYVAGTYYDKEVEEALESLPDPEKIWKEIEANITNFNVASLSGLACPFCIAHTSGNYCYCYECTYGKIKGKCATRNSAYNKTARFLDEYALQPFVPSFYNELLETIAAKEKEETESKSELKALKTFKAYKAFNSDLTCRDFQYEIGKTFNLPVKPILCDYGFHACRNMLDCFDYYPYRIEGNYTRICEVEILGDVIEDGNKLVTNKIKIIKEITINEINRVCNFGENNQGIENTGDNNKGLKNTGDNNEGHNNTGSNNVGHGNSGHQNKGNRNTGGHNTGGHNTGDHNTGNSNTGDHNTGNSNTGNSNTGYRNTGRHNTGNRNTGHSNKGSFNSGNYNKTNNSSGYFNQKPPERIYFFDTLLTKKQTIKFLNNSEIIFYFITPFFHLTKNDWKVSISNKTKKLLFSVKGFTVAFFEEMTGVQLSPADLLLLAETRKNF
jgi:hypothetical protein